MGVYHIFVNPVKKELVLTDSALAARAAESVRTSEFSVFNLLLMRGDEMSDLYDPVAYILVGYFSYQFYEVAIKDLQKAIQTHKGAANQWNEAVSIIQSRTLPAGEPLKLVHNEANRSIYENTDEEAYNWLDLMIANVTRVDGQIAPYPQAIHGE